VLNVMEQASQTGQDKGGGFRFEEEGDIDGGDSAQNEAGTPQKGNPSAQAFGFFLVHQDVLCAPCSVHRFIERIVAVDLRGTVHGARI
jgi:hypothetical protein